jgi:RNA polymerase I-specific transcription initiation factor RRN7
MATKGTVCGVENCRSKRYEEGEDGFLYCQNGHRQAGLVRGDDNDDYISASRTVTKKKNIEEDEKKVGKTFKGPRAFDLYLKSLQLILRHQVWFLVHEKGLPSELETVIYDLWALRVAQLGDKIARNDDETPETQSQSQQVFSTLESEANDATDNETGQLRKQTRKRGLKLLAAPNLKDCLALCYLGIVTLRLPFTPGDVHAWITDGKLPYRRAIKLLPLTMRDRLPPTFHAVLDPNTPLTYSRFYETLVDLQMSYDKDHRIVWPALNVPLLLFRYLKELALPLELYDATKRLGGLLGHDFAPHYEEKKRLGIRHFPEAQLVSCLIVCIKLLYPLDGIKRYPRSSSESTATTVNWDLWCKQMKLAEEMQQGDGGRFTTEQMTKLKEEDVFSMSPDEMDQYLDFYADTYLDEAEIQRTRNTDDFRNALYDLFPIEGETPHPPSQMSNGLSLQQKIEVVKAVHGGMKTIAPVADEDAGKSTIRAGQAYQVWKTAEELPEAARTLYERATRIAGLSMEMLVLAVGFTEARLETWKKVQKGHKTR